MLDIQFIRENTEEVKKAIADKQLESSLVDKVLELDERWRKILKEVEELRSERNKAAEAKDIKRGKEIKEKLQKLEPALKEVEGGFKEVLWQIPNIVAEDVPIGKDETGNKVIRKWGEVSKFDFQPKDHVELGESLQVIDTKRASEIVGARFAYLKGDGALLEFALVQFALSVLTDEKILKEIADKVEKGYSPKPFVAVVPPVMIKEDVFDKMARLHPKEERYFIPTDNLYLIGSAEHTLGPLHMNEVLNEKDLPIRYVGFSTSFRREAGSYGKDTKGILRVHQFDKIELESFTTPENGLKEQEFFVAIQEYLMQKLELPYQVVAICTGDMGSADFRQIDVETWLPGQGGYRETHTSDYMTDYQSRRLNVKLAGRVGSELVHMNDATAFAIGRTIIAILENYQEKDGSVVVPEVLRKWMGKEKITP